MALRSKYCYHISARIIPVVPLFIDLWSLITCAIKLPPSAIKIDFSYFGPYMYSESLSGHYVFKCPVPNLLTLNRHGNRSLTFFFSEDSRTFFKQLISSHWDSFENKSTTHNYHIIKLLYILFLIFKFLLQYMY